MADFPNPQHKRNPLNPAKTLPKVFIAFPHKPTSYKQLPPPPDATGELLRQYEDHVVQLGKQAQLEVQRHEEAVKGFADFLSQQSIAVAYELLVRDTGVDNITRWCQTQIKDSDYLILIVTESLCDFLNGKGPREKEPLFSSDYLYNLIHGHQQKLQIVPVFLFTPKNLSHVPKALEASSMYEIWGNYREPLTDEGLTSLLARLTGQNRYQPPEPLQAPIRIAPRRRRFGQGVVETDSGSARSTLSSTLLQNQTPLDITSMSRLAEQSVFSQHWKTIARHLGLSEAEIERCEGRGGSDESEACLQMLRVCAEQRDRQPLTVSSLSSAITRSGAHSLLHSLNSIIAH